MILTFHEKSETCSLDLISGLPNTDRGQTVKYNVEKGSPKNNHSQVCCNYAQWLQKTFKI